ncbi:MAG: transporter, family, multidrug resistance protein [Gaiellales bacterium]|nr:transporter, family, multidrug resistance protein [Gaiellales bacterium]
MPLLCAMAATGAASMDMYLPALPHVARSLGVSASATQVTITTFFGGLCAGHLVAGPLSDLWGRRRPLLLGYAVYVAATVSCAVAPSILALASARFAQGLAAASGMVLSRAIVRDLHTGSAAARMLSRLALALGSTAALAPLVGALLIGHTSWRGIFALQAAFGALLWLAVIAFLPETHLRAGRQGGLRSLLHAFGRLLRSPSFTGNAAVLALSSGASFAIISASSFVVQDVYGRSATVFGVVFGSGAATIVALSLLNVRLLRGTPPIRVLRIGLAVNVVAAAALLVAVLAGMHLFVVAVFIVAVFGSWGALIVPNATALAMADHPDSAGSASALLGIIQYATGAVVAPLVGLAGSGSAVPFAVVIALCSGAAAARFVAMLARMHPPTAMGA